jgi:hypothetical protein
MSHIFPHHLCTDIILDVLLYLPLDDFLNCNIEDPDLRRQWLNYHTRIETRLGNTEYLVHDKLHREDGPAQVNNEREAWYFNGNRHRLGASAVRYFDSPNFEEWRKHGKIHRDDGGPAVRIGTSYQWWYEGKRFRAGGGPTEVNTKTNLELWHDTDGKLHRDDGPAVIQMGDLCHWKKHGVLHRIGGPAIESGDGENEWWVDGQRHRLDGPAVDLKDRKEYYRKGEKHREDGPAVMVFHDFRNEWDETWYIKGKEVDPKTRKPLRKPRRSVKRTPRRSVKHTQRKRLLIATVRLS